MTTVRKKRDLKQADLSKWITILKLQIKHPSWNNQDIAKELGISRERVRQLKLKIGSKSVKEMIELRDKLVLDSDG